MRFLFICIILLTVGALCWRFPYALHNREEVRFLIYPVLLLIVITLTNKRVNRQTLPKVLRDAGIWLGIVLLLVLGYSFRGVFSERMLGELMPQMAQERGDGSIIVRASEGGHFFIEARVNEANVRFMVDTGASDIVLSPGDAERAGINLASLSYEHEYSTANGYGRGATTSIDHITIGSFSMSRLPVSVNKADMDYSLLGMSYLKRLRSFRVEGNTLVLIP